MVKFKDADGKTCYEDTKGNPLSEEEHKAYIQRIYKEHCDEEDKQRSDSRMNDIEKEMFHEEINSVPHWVNSTGKIEAYTRHLSFRLKEKTMRLDRLFEYLRQNHKNIFNEYLDSRHVLEKDIDNMCREYDDFYNGLKSG